MRTPFIRIASYFALSVLALLGLLDAAAAAQIQVSEGWGFSSGAILIRIQGEIVPGDEQTFSTLAASIPKGGALVSLNSNGGNAQAAMMIGNAVLAKHFVTALAGTHQCESACTFILLAGAHVYVERGAFLGFHRPSISGQESAEGTAWVADYLRGLGLTEQQVSYMLSAPPNGIRFATPADAVALGFRPQVVFCPLGLCNWRVCQRRWCYVTP